MLAWQDLAGLHARACSMHALSLFVFCADEDGDRILISSDEELSLGLQSAGGQLFRVHALHVPKEETEQEQTKPTAPQPGQAPRTGHTHQHHHHHRGSQDGAYHHGVVCDGCEGRIFGIRYKCLSCVDFDLCSSCEAKGLHNQHNMVAMEHPQPHFGWGHWGRGRGRRCGQWRGGHPYYHHHQGQQSWGCPWGNTRGGTSHGGPSQWYGDFFGGSTEQRREAVHQVLQQITPFLHHFGVEVDARVVDDPPNEQPAKEGEGSKPAPPTTTQDTMDVRNGAEFSRVRVLCCVVMCEGACGSLSYVLVRSWTECTYISVVRVVCCVVMCEGGR